MDTFPYEWLLKDGYPSKGIDKHACKVFSTFSCGGGSTMGYKLAGYDVLGCNEIDEKMMRAYKKNHNPKYSYLEPIQDLKLRDDLPEELYNLDILDGSPPCSNFSVAGNREKDWGVKKKFREGQAEQVLDTLFFDFIDLAKKLQPKVVISENVKGMLIGNAIQYCTRVYEEFDAAGYYCQHWVLSGSDMGLPQSRVRVFFICLRKDLAEPFLYQKNLFDMLPKLDLEFNEPEVPYSAIESPLREEKGKHIPAGILPFWEKIEPGRSCSDVHPKGHYFQELKLHPDKPVPTIRACSNSYYHYKDPRRLYDEEIMKAGSYPLDYELCGNQAIYLVGMSVPPIMMAKVAQEVYLQWLKPLAESS